MAGGKLVRFKPSARQQQSNRNIARIARRTINNKMETKANMVKIETPTNVKFHHEGVVNFEELTEITQGDNDRQRIGNSIMGRRVHLRLLFRNSDNADAADGAVRVIIVRSKAGALPASTWDYLNPVGDDGFPQILDEDTLVIKHDRVYQMGTSKAVAGSAQYPPFRSIDLTFRGLGKVRYAENSDTIASVNPWYLLFYRVDNSGAATSPMTYVMSSRLYFKDA